MSSISSKNNYFTLMCLIASLCITNIWCSMHVEQIPPPHRVKQCREGCLEKYAIRDIACLQSTECSMCLDQCASNSKLNTITNTWSLKVITMIRNLSLVTADIAWPSFNNDNMQCLVTWEVSGGGLMGNLLTETSSVELSLWPETKYRIQVTCKNKDSEALTRSLPLTLDTHYAIIQLATTSATELASSSSSPDAAVIVTPATIDTMKSIVSADTRESSSSSSNSNSHGSGSGSSTSSINHNQHKHRVQQKEDENNDEWQHLDEQPAPSHHHNHHQQQQQQHFQQSSSSSSSSAAHHHQQTASAAEILYEEYPATTSALTTFGNNIWNILIRRKEAALGLCIGILGFFIVILALSIVLRRRKSRSNDKENLIENEFMADVNSQILHV